MTDVLDKAAVSVGFATTGKRRRERKTERERERRKDNRGDRRLLALGVWSPVNDKEEV